MTALFAADGGASFGQIVLIGLVTGSLYALIAIGYTMVYGIIELINFAHGDLFMLGSFMALTHLTMAGLASPGFVADAPAYLLGWMVVLAILISATFCAALNVTVDRVVYKPLRNAPKLAPLVSAIGVSFIFMNVGQFWFGPLPQNFPRLIPDRELFPGFGYRDLMVVGLTVPAMVGLTLFVKYT